MAEGLSRGELSELAILSGGHDALVNGAPDISATDGDVEVRSGHLGVSCAPSRIKPTSFSQWMRDRKTTSNGGELDGFDGRGPYRKPGRAFEDALRLIRHGVEYGRRISGQ
jgi:hypothetical protein